jgi:hypothetical protein
MHGAECEEKLLCHQNPLGPSRGNTIRNFLVFWSGGKGHKKRPFKREKPGHRRCDASISAQPTPSRAICQPKIVGSLTPAFTTSPQLHQDSLWLRPIAGSRVVEADRVANFQRARPAYPLQNAPSGARTLLHCTSQHAEPTSAMRQFRQVLRLLHTVGPCWKR